MSFKRALKYDCADIGITVVHGNSFSSRVFVWGDHHGQYPLYTCIAKEIERLIPHYGCEIVCYQLDGSRLSKYPLNAIEIQSIMRSGVVVDVIV